MRMRNLVLALVAISVGISHDFDLRLPSAKFDCAGDPDDFTLERGDPLVSRYFLPGFNEPSERLIGVFSSEIDKCSPEWAGRGHSLSRFVWLSLRRVRPG